MAKSNVSSTRYIDLSTSTPGIPVLLGAISDFLDDQGDMIERVRCDLARGLSEAIGRLGADGQNSKVRQRLVRADQRLGMLAVARLTGGESLPVVSREWGGSWMGLFARFP